MSAEAGLVGALAGILATMLMALLRAVLGPSVYDRILAVNSFGTATVLFICVLSFWMGRPDFIDLGLLYALMNFIGTIALLRFFKHGNLAEDSD